MHTLPNSNIKPLKINNKKLASLLIDQPTKSNCWVEKGMNKCIVCVSACWLAACGGGGGSTSPATTPSSSTPAPAPVSSAPASTALKDHTLATTSQITAFRDYQLQLPNRSSQFRGAPIYVKVYTADGNSLYLGHYEPNRLLGLQLPPHLKVVKVDLFSANPNDPQLSEEISL